MADDFNPIDRTVDIVSAYVSNNPVPPSGLSALIKSVYATLSAPRKSSETVAQVTATLVPAVSVKKSISGDWLICLEDGQKFKSLKRHLLTKYGLTPDAYRVKWNLPRDYPMVAPSYSATRSTLAKANGLGQKGMQAKSTAPTPSSKSANRVTKKAVAGV
ncbi:MucR family transcriptional regulator [Asticcacaulis benevestitus]|uniref:MucR family transcriptional regulator n=1 Tax=Asticcacaulis benevestitus DSM 16100 = ATCC BAA-896 TaxID=1121022 RepID=V4RMX9_9CAUL|nr:MucR family transcriptional regulator [Asticcacaulis benevestitus]ESQ92593.1 hypothetical protein ABENE_08115 [Asticcacaulis benevestitus DSM 16100 = ATCC BAA-896]